MYLVALATDYDGTLAEDGQVDAPTLEALERLKASGRRMVLVTGRELGDLKAAFPELDRFDTVVAENGSLLYFPGTDEERAIAPEPPAVFVELLRARGVSPLSIGQPPLHRLPGAQRPEEGHQLPLVVAGPRAVMTGPCGASAIAGSNGGRWTD